MLPYDVPLLQEKKLRLKLESLLILVRGAVNQVGPEGYRIINVEARISVDVDKSEASKAEKCVAVTGKRNSGQSIVRSKSLEVASIALQKDLYQLVSQYCHHVCKK